MDWRPSQWLQWFLPVISEDGMRRQSTRNAGCSDGSAAWRASPGWVSLVSFVSPGCFSLLRWWAWKQCRIRSWSQKTAEFRWPKLPSFRENQLWSWWSRSEWAMQYVVFPTVGGSKTDGSKMGCQWPKRLAVHSGKTFVFWRLNILNHNHTYHFNRTPWERPQDIQWMLARSPWFIHSCDISVNIRRLHWLYSRDSSDLHSHCPAFLQTALI